ncbi:MAG: hypothetical protein Q7S59_07060, partial [Sulfurimonas sp.]|nr:hypothetical protein [Sulfurimonas sp.]
MKKYSALQQISLWWYRTFDINGFIFYSLKTFGKLYRFTFYIFLTLGIFAFMFFIGKIININNLVVEEELVAIINNLCYFILITGTLLTGLIVSYEFIIEEDMDNYLMQRRSQKDAIMLNKKQWWRLRNMHFLVRLAIYLILYLILRYVLIKTSLLAFVDTY